MNPLLDQGLSYHGFDETVNRFVGEPLSLVGSMLPQGIEYGMSGGCSERGLGMNNKPQKTARR
jgi:hypothetical protein